MVEVFSDISSLAQKEKRVYMILAALSEEEILKSKEDTEMTSLSYKQIKRE